MIDALSAATRTANPTGLGQETIDKTFTDFIALLTTQLENQLPTDPVDTSQFTDQITNMTLAQEQINTNTLLKELVALSGGGELDNAVSYIGRVIEAPGNKSQLISNGEEAGGVFIYDLPVEARAITITIQDKTGRVVYSGEALGNEGRNEVVWDGSNSLTGELMPSGAYSFKINAKDFNNNDIDATTYTTGIVTSADVLEGNVTLSLGDIKIPVSDVLAIKSAQELL